MTIKRPPQVFKSESQEREFWENNDSAGIVDWSKAERAPSKLETHINRNFAPPPQRFVRAHENSSQ